MEYDKLTKEELVRILDDIRSPRFSHRQADHAEIVRLLEALLLERYELQSQIGSLKDSLALAEDALSEYVHLFETAPLPYITLDMSACILKMNRCACALVGKERQLMLGLPFWSVLTEESRFLFMQHFNECRRSHNQVKSVALRLASKESAIPITMTGCYTDTYHGLLSPKIDLP